MPFARQADVRLYWREDGARNRPALLLLNAIGTEMTLWDRALPYLTPCFHVIRLDSRGHGASDVPAGDYRLEQLAMDAQAVMDAAGVQRAAVCGISLGGMVALALALQAPARVGALICACSSAQMERAGWEARLQTVRGGGMAAVAQTAIGRFFGAHFQRTHPDEVATVRAALLATDPQGYAGCAAAIRDMDLLGRLGDIHVPTLILSGDHDISTPFDSHGARILAAIPGARHARLDTAHLACVEAPAAFASAVRQFAGEPAAAELQAARTLQFEAGLRQRREVLGEAWVERALQARTPFNEEYQSLITRYAWQEIWSRPGLEQRTRRLLVIAMTVALGRWEEFRLHVRSGLERGGFTVDELKETLLQSAIYAGVPAANTAFNEAAGILAELAAR